MKVIKNDTPSIKDQARAELVEERTEEFKEKLKSKMKELQAAKVIVKNIEREIDLLEKKIDQEINDIG